jgi:hypothetical protein
MTNKRVLVMTGMSDINQDVHDPNRTDNTYADVHNLTLNSKERYARKHGYDFLSVRSFGSDHLGRFSPSEIGQMRAYRAFRLLEEYDVVMWIDADSIITCDDYSLEDFGIDENHSFYASYDWSWKQSFSTGNFILNKTDRSELLFKTYYDNAKQFPEEQMALNGIYRSDANGLRSTMKILDHKFLGSIPSVEMYHSVGTWQGRANIPWPWNEGDFLLHVTGVQNKHRIAVLKKYFERYL